MVSHIGTRDVNCQYEIDTHTNFHFPHPSSKCTTWPVAILIQRQDMPPRPTELENWWLNHGHKALEELVSCRDLELGPRDVGFAQAIQHKLRAFDHDQQLQAELLSDCLAVRASQETRISINPRKKLKDAATQIFRSSEDGGIDQRRALEGLGHLDDAEVHRLQLLTATKLAVDSGDIEEEQLQIIRELDQAATKRHGEFHMGFRARVRLIDMLEAIALLTKNLVGAH